MSVSLANVSFKLPAMAPVQKLKASTIFLSKKIGQFVDEHVNINKLIIITSVALSALATLASIVYGSMLTVSLSLSFVAASCLCYKINQELFEKGQECKKLQNFLIDEERQKLAHLEEHERMTQTISRLELSSQQHEAFGKELQSRLARALELIEFCDKVVGQASEFTKRSEAVSAELESYKGVLGVWLVEIRKMIDRGDETEKSSQKVIRILEDFSRGQHTELARMLEQLQEVQRLNMEIRAQNEDLKEATRQQQEALKKISQGIAERTEALHAVHTKLMEVHLAQIRDGADKEHVAINLDPVTVPREE